MEKSEYYVSCVGKLCLTRAMNGKAPIVIVIDKVVDINGLNFSGKIIYPNERLGGFRKNKH